MHPQYVLENGVDFAHFKFVHKTPIVPVFTRHDFDEPVSYVDFTITFEGDDGPDDRGRQQRRGGHQRRPGHRGDQELGDGRQPHHLGDHTRRRPHLRRPLHGLHRPHARQGLAERARPRRASSATRSSGSSPRTSTSGSHQRYSDPPALAGAEYEGFTAIRNWAKQFYPDGSGGSAAEVYRTRKV